MAVANNAKAPMTHEKDKPRSKEPLYSREFIPRPTKATAKMLPTVRTCGKQIDRRLRLPPLSTSSFLASCTVKPSAATSETAIAERRDHHRQRESWAPRPEVRVLLHGSAATFTPSCLCLAVVMYLPD